MKKLILIFLFIPFLLFAKDAWWLKGTFEAKETEILGMPAKAIDPTFKRISVINYDLVIKKFPEAKKDLEANYARFVLDKFYNGKKHHIVVGPYSNDGVNTSGSFLLVLEQDKGKWKNVFLKTQPKTNGFAILIDGGDSVVWNSCLNCGPSALLRWKKNGDYYFEDMDEPEDEQ